MSYFQISNDSRQSGFSLLEVLISLLVMSIGLLGLGGLQIVSLKGTAGAHSRTIATMYAMELADRMRANPKGAKGGFYASSVTCSDALTACRRTTYCTPEQVAKFDLQEIMCGMKRGTKREGGIVNLLTDGTLNVSCDVACNTKKALHHISVSWKEGKSHQQQATENELQTKNLVVSIIP